MSVAGLVGDAAPLGEPLVADGSDVNGGAAPENQTPEKVGAESDRARPKGDFEERRLHFVDDARLRCLYPFSRSQDAYREIRQRLTQYT
jgi:hypothetical protein